MKFLLLMLSEANGKPSGSRGLTVLIAVVVLGCWAYVTIEKRELQPLSPELMTLVLGALGIKAWQRGKESSPDGPTLRAGPGGNGSGVKE